jgi:predicted nucleic acid-binding protein
LTKAERQKMIAVWEALLLLDDILTTPPLLHSYEPLRRRAAVISSRTRAGLYDSLYVALAEREGCEVVMADDKAVRNRNAAPPALGCGAAIC